MVVFICNSCNSSLKKNGVDQHLLKCRSIAVSCVDCGVEFADNSYKNHIQCVSEDVKYGPQDDKSVVLEKGQRKQIEWLNNIKKILTTVNLSGPAEMSLNKLLEYPNIPRKKPKFVNFVQNCVHIHSQDIIDQLWDICSSANKACKEQESQSETVQSPDEVSGEMDEKEKKKKKRKKQNDDDGDEPRELGENKSTEETNGDKENSDQQNGVGDGVKKSKKKKKQDPDESKSEKEDQDNGADAKPTDDHPVHDDDKTESIPVSGNDQTEANSLSTCDNEKKKSKKKKRDHEVSHDDGGDADETESESKKKLKVKEEDEGNCDEKVDQDADQQPDPTVPSEQSSETEKPMNWFKQLKRQVKEKETVKLKELKKMIKKIRKASKLDDDQDVLVEKALIKLKKRHNYSVSEGQISYQRLF